MDAVRTFDDLHVSAGDTDALGVTPRSGVRAPPSDASPLFATPSSAMSGLTGGVLWYLRFCVG